MRKNAPFSVLSFKTFSAMPANVVFIEHVDHFDRTVTQSGKMNVSIIEYIKSSCFRNPVHDIDLN